jgi:putative transposase
MADWAASRFGLHFIPHGQPWRNGDVESFNSKLRDECLNITSFWSLDHARVVLSEWKHDYNPTPPTVCCRRVGLASL